MDKRLDLRGKDVLVVGTKRSGLGAIELLERQGARVRAMDSGTLTEGEQGRFKQLGVQVVPQEAEHIGQPDLVVLSPAVPAELPLFEAVRGHGVPVIGEVELASYFLRGPIAGITGSNGKTTTTALLGHLLASSGIDCQVGGNIGTAITTLVESSHEGRWNVLELSSFQLETIEHFHARVAACLNITPDHLDRHGTLASYIDAKRQLFLRQREGDVAVLNYDDPVCREFAAATPADVLWFSSTQAVPQGASLQGGDLRLNGKPFINRSRIRLRGTHNVENALAATLMAQAAGAPLEKIALALETFSGVEHRIEFVRELAGVGYYNDSKATNVDAALKAIGSFSGGLWIILGGKDKGSDYRPLREPLAAAGKGVLLVGAAAPLIREALTGAVPMHDCGTLEIAIPYAREHARPGDTVLLAPACASFDQFQNYEERGKRFKQIVLELA